MTPILEIDRISKQFARGRDKVAALKSVSLAIEPGDVFGLLGPNGAGKSTLLRIVLGLVRQSSGECHLFGRRMDRSPGALRRVGSLIDTTRLYPYLSGAETLDVLARTSGFRLGTEERRGLLARVGLREAAGRRVGDYSLGMKQRLGIATALIGSPELVILDEPTNGLDPTGIQDMRVLIRDIVNRDSVTVILSSHQLDEVQRICDRVAILDKGALIFSGSLADLLGDRRLIIDAEPLDLALKLVGAYGELCDGGVKIAITRQDAPSLLRELMSHGIRIYEARWIGGNLEDLFIAKTERQKNVG
jgi:ABC-2 type transport system ATP-binding protein